MKNLTYDQLSPEAQSEAICEVDRRNPVNTRSKTILDLCQDYEYNRHGEIMEDAPDRQFREHLYSENFSD